MNDTSQTLISFDWRSVALFILLLFPLLVVRIDQWPPPYFDEGVFLHAAKNISLHGEYAVLSAGEFSRFDLYLDGGGPMLLGPIVATFKVAGIGLLQGRAVSVMYALLAVLLYSLVAHWRTGPRGTLVSLGLLVFAPWSEFLKFSRLAMGEMASFTLILAAFLVLCRAIDNGLAGWFLVSGVLLGLACLTKPQNLIAIGAVGLVGAADIIYYRRVGLKRWMVCLAIALLLCLVWQGVKIRVLGYPEYVSRLRQGDAATRALATLTRPSRILANFNNLAKTGYLLWMAPALFYGWSEVIQQRREGLVDFLWLTLTTLWLLWYVLGSIGWVRYAFIPIALSNLFLADLFGTVTHDFDFSSRKVNRALGDDKERPVLARLAIATVPVVVVAYGLVVYADQLINERSVSAQQMAEYLIAEVDPEDTVESMEWEVDFLARNAFHHPPFEVLELAIRRDQLGIPPTSLTYGPGATSAPYLLDGPMSKAVEIYDAYVPQHCTLAKSVGPYDLYRCRP